MLCKVRARKWRGAHAGWVLCVRRAGGRARARMCGEGTHAHRVHLAFQGGLGWRWRQGWCGEGGGVEAEGEGDGGNGQGGDAQRVVNGGEGGGEGGGGGGDGGKGTLPGGSIRAAREVAAARRAVWVTAMWR